MTPPKTDQKRRDALRLLGAGILVPNIIIPSAYADRRATRARRTPPPSIVGRSAIVIDADAMKVLYQKSADTKRAVASTQKLMTSLLVIERGNLDSYMTIASTDTRVEPSKLYLKAGHRYRRRALVEALLVKSGNDVARALARDHSGSQVKFAAAMNARAQRLGMRNTNFVTSNGLPASGQYSTARDIGILSLAAYKNRAIRTATKKRAITFRFADGRKRTLTNTNKLLGRSPYCNGLKTGYTRSAGRCLASSGSRGTKDIIVVVLGSNSKYIWADSQKLLHWGLGIS